MDGADFSHYALKPLSDEMRDAKGRAEVLNALDGERREFIRLVQSAYEFARLAYEAAKGWRPQDASKTQEQAKKVRTLLAGDFSEQYLAVILHVKSAHCGGDAANTKDKVQKAVKWLDGHGLNSIPKFVSESASTVKLLFKDTSSVARDMKDFREAARKTRRESALAAERQKR